MNVIMRNSRDVERKGGKLNRKWIGKYKILEINNNCVKLYNIETQINLKRKINISKIRPLYEFNGKLIIIQTILNLKNYQKKQQI